MNVFSQLRSGLVMASLAAVSTGTVLAQSAPPPVDPAAEKIRLAEGLLSRNFTDLARAELEKFLQANPDHELAPQATQLLVECLRVGGKKAEAIQGVDRFLLRWPRHAKAQTMSLLKCELLIDLGRTADARQLLAELAAKPDASSAREAATYYLAQAEAKDGRIDAALALLAKLSVLPLTADTAFRACAVLGEGVLRQQLGDWNGAQLSYRKLADAPAAPAAMRAEAAYRLAEAAFLQGNQAQALERYDRMLQEFPGSLWVPEAARRRIWTLFNLKEYTRAVAAAEDLGAQYGEGCLDDALCVKGLSLVALSRLADASAVLEKLLARTTLSPDVRRLVRCRQVYCLAGTDKWPEALAAAEAFLAEYPKTPEKPDVQYLKGEALFRQEKWADAAASFRQALDGFAGDWPFLEPCAERFGNCLVKQGKTRTAAAAVYRSLAGRAEVPRRPAKLLRAGELEREDGRLDEAAHDFQRLRTEFAGTPEARQATRRLAEIETERKRYDRAEALVLELLKMPEEQMGRLLLFAGFLNYLQKKYPEAEQELNHACAELKSDPSGLAEARFYLACVLLDQQREAEALALFGELLSLPEAVRPRLSPELLFRLEQLYFDRGLLVEGEKACGMLRANPDAAVRDRAQLVSARLLLAQGQDDQALALLKDLQQPSPPRAAAAEAGVRAAALSMLGEWAARNGQHDRAVAAFLESLKLDGGGGAGAARARWGIAQIFFREGRLQQAQEQAVSAFVLGDDPAYTPKTMYLAVQILVAMKNPAEALTTWRELMARYPAFAETKKNDQLVRDLEAAAAPPATDKRGAGSGTAAEKKT